MIDDGVAFDIVWNGSRSATVPDADLLRPVDWLDRKGPDVRYQIQCDEDRLARDGRRRRWIERRRFGSKRQVHRTAAEYEEMRERLAS